MLQLCSRAQQDRMIGLGATAPLMKQYFSQNYCTPSSARAIARFSGDGGPHRKPDRGDAVSFRPSFLLFLLSSFIRRPSACSLLLFLVCLQSQPARPCDSFDFESDSECPPKYTSYYFRPDFFSCVLYYRYKSSNREDVLKYISL